MMPIEHMNVTNTMPDIAKSRMTDPGLTLSDQAPSRRYGPTFAYHPHEDSVPKEATDSPLCRHWYSIDGILY